MRTFCHRHSHHLLEQYCYHPRFYIQRTQTLHHRLLRYRGHQRLSVRLDPDHIWHHCVYPHKYSTLSKKKRLKPNRKIIEDKQNEIKKKEAEIKEREKALNDVKDVPVVPKDSKLLDPRKSRQRLSVETCPRNNDSDGHRKRYR